MRAMDVMVRDVITVKPDDDVAEVIKLLTENDVSALPVVDDKWKRCRCDQRSRPHTP
jgi:CBS domain-containing protein